ncbi:MAG: ABC transporter permease [Caldilineae bacterium]|nr:MAG: ABC transporter permease [Caldilineae bacterium]
MQGFFSLIKSRWRRHVERTAIAMMTLVLAVLFIAEAYIHHESHYDRWVPHYRQVARLEVPYHNEPDGHLPLSQPGLYSRLSGMRGVIEKVGRISQVKAWTFQRAEGASLRSEFVLPLRFADPAFVDIFGLRTIAGEDAASALAEPDALVLTADQVRRLAPGTSPEALIGTGLSVKGSGRQFRIRAIIADPPKNSHLKLAALASFRRPPPDIPTEGLASLLTLSVYTYLRLRPGITVETAQAKLRAMLSQPTGDSSPFFTIGRIEQYRLMPVARIYADARGIGEMKPPRDPGLWNSVRLLHTLTWLLFALNMMVFVQGRLIDGIGSLAVHRLAGMGWRHGLAFGFMQSLLPMLIAAGVGILLAIVICGVSEARELLSAWLQSGAVTMAIVRVVVALLIVAAVSCIPVVGLMATRPARLLRERDGGLHGTRLQAGLVAVELGAVALVLFGTLLAWRQIAFLSTLPRGMDTADRFVAKIYVNEEPWRLHAFLERMARKLGAVSHVAADIVLPMRFDLSKHIQLADSGFRTQAHVFHVQGDLPSALGVPLLAGHWFQEQPRAGQQGGGRRMHRGVVVSAALAHSFGFSSPTTILGHELRIPDLAGGDAPKQETLPVIGVVGDVRWAAPEIPARPVVYLWSRKARPFSVFMHVPHGRADHLERALKAAYEAQFGPTVTPPLAVLPLATALNSLDPHLLARMRLYGVFAVAVVIASVLGLLGHMRVSLARMRRTMALHRLFGAEAGAIHGLAIRRLLWLVLAGTAIGLVIGWQQAVTWLAGFVDRIQPTIGDAFMATSVPIALAVGVSVIQVQAVIRRHIAELLRPTP